MRLGAVYRRVAILVGSLVLVACRDGVSPRFVDSVRLFPDSAHMALGEVFEFRVLVLDQRGDSLPERTERVRISNRNPDVVNAEVRASTLRITSVAPGTATLEAQLGFGTGSAVVFVAPESVARIAIDPSPVTVPNDGQAAVQARLFDAADQELDPAGHRISWRVLNSTVTVGSPAATATLRAGNFLTLPRTDTLVLVVDDLSVRTLITVR